jgi:hypothetical protein
MRSWFAGNRADELIFKLGSNRLRELILYVAR